MTDPLTIIKADAPVARLVALITGGALRHIPGVDAGNRLVGIVTRTELIAVLNQALVTAQGR